MAIKIPKQAKMFDAKKVFLKNAVKSVVPKKLGRPRELSKTKIKDSKSSKVTKDALSMVRSIKTAKTRLGKFGGFGRK